MRRIFASFGTGPAPRAGKAPARLNTKTEMALQGFFRRDDILSLFSMLDEVAWKIFPGARRDRRRRLTIEYWRPPRLGAVG
jgi:hypothetical protein